MVPMAYPRERPEAPVGQVELGVGLLGATHLLHRQRRAVHLEGDQRRVVTHRLGDLRHAGGPIEIVGDVEVLERGVLFQREVAVVVRLRALRSRFIEAIDSDLRLERI